MLKYILFGVEEDLPQIVIFDTITNHSTIKNKMELPVISAGKITKGWNCISGSVTLGLNFNKERSEADTAIIARMIELG